MDSYYAERVSDGTYAAIAKQFVDLGQNALANASCPEDFSKVEFAPPGGKSFMETFGVKGSGQPFVTLLFGEICPALMGTRISATGSFYLGGNKVSVLNRYRALSTCADSDLADYR